MKISFLVPGNDKDSVEREYSRRIDLGFIFEGNRYQADNSAHSAMSMHAIDATIAIASGAGDKGNYRWQDPDSDFQFITADNKRVTMDAPTVQRMYSTFVAFRNKLRTASRDIKDRIKDGETFPNVQDDTLWSKPNGD